MVPSRDSLIQCLLCISMFVCKGICIVYDYNSDNLCTFPFTTVSKSSLWTWRGTIVSITIWGCGSACVCVCVCGIQVVACMHVYTHSSLQCCNVSPPDSQSGILRTHEHTVPWLTGRVPVQNHTTLLLQPDLASGAVVGQWHILHTVRVGEEIGRHGRDRV